MQHIKFFRILLLVLIVLAVCTAAYADSRFSQVSCLEVRVLTDENQITCREQTSKDLSGYFYFKNEPAAVDRESRTIYISQNISGSTRFQDLEGNLTLAYKDFRLYFAPDPCFDDLKAAIAENHRFRLLAADPEGNYAEYAVVFTSLPVLRLDTLSTDEAERYIFGNICLWTPDDPDQLRYSVKTSSAEWHVRGATSAYMPKTPYKLNLKTSKQENRALSLLGLGKDDDWILNAMYLDDTKLKERLFIALWNDMVADTPYNLPMSNGEYIELVINQEYKGVFLLQRRIDSKYLELPANSILVKGMDIQRQELIQENYEIVSSPFHDADTFSILYGMWEGDYSGYDINNFVDISLFLHFTSAPDNTTPKNMFYVLNPADSGYRVTLIPWDTDMSLGVTWTDGFTYDYEKSLTSTVRRMEYDAMLELHPDLNERMAARWQELRETVLSEENILSHLTRLETQLAESGVPVRESQKWGEFYGGSDAVENLYRFIREKLPLMDKFYAQ